MPRIKCHYENCKFLDVSYCSAPKVEIDPFDGCMTYEEVGALVREGVIEDDGDTLEDGWEDMGFEDDDDFWLDDDDES
ncbi:MAG: hypothetical protein FVQ83_05070 [Chloroflexi bacterium]|nr:hypothetical protein [Chloroflexota bacterium]